MRKIAMPALFVLVVAALGLGQATNGTGSNQSTTTPQIQNGNSSIGNPDQNTPTANPNGVQPANQNSTQQAPDQNQSNSAWAQRPVPGGGEAPANTEMRATLDTPLSSKTSQPGDRFTATISEAVQGRNSVAIPVGARVEGEVSESEEGKNIPALRGKGKLNLRFRDIVLPNGQTVPLVASLVSVNSTNGRTTQKADNEGQVESGTQGKSVAKDVGIGAGVGTVAGLIFGGPLKGLAIGALAGGGYVLATNGKDVNLPAQTGMVIRLDQPLNVQ